MTPELGQHSIEHSLLIDRGLKSELREVVVMPWSPGRGYGTHWAPQSLHKWGSWDSNPGLYDLRAWAGVADIKGNWAQRSESEGDKTGKESKTRGVRKLWERRQVPLGQARRLRERSQSRSRPPAAQPTPPAEAFPHRSWARP